MTLGRSTLVLPLAPLVAVTPPWPDGLAWWVMGVGTLALVLDGVDGWVARRTGSATTFGARFDMELDSLLMLVLAVLVWRSGAVGAWVILIGLPRYLFVAAGWIWPWLQGELPERRRRKAVCVAQGVLLLVCLGPVIPDALVTVSAITALALLTWSFAVDVAWLARHRPPRCDMTTLDTLIVLAFVVYAVSAGLRHRQQASKNLEEYFLAGRSLPGWKAGLSMAASQFAADTPLLVTGILATAGIFGVWQLWIFALTFLLIGFVLAGAWRRAGVVTDAELVEVRYGGSPAAILRGIKALYLGTIVNCVTLAWVLFAAGKIAEPFLVWDVWLPPGMLDPLIRLVEAVGVPLTLGGVADPEVWINTTNNLISLLLILGVTALYSATGGLRGVAATDVVQVAIMLVGTLLFAVAVVIRGRRAELGHHADPRAVRDRRTGRHPAGPDPRVHPRSGQGRHAHLPPAAGGAVARQLGLGRERLPRAARDGLSQRP